MRADGRVPRIEGMSELRPVGSGGFATVWRAREEVIGREVAIKVLEIDDASAADRDAFVRECRAMGAVSRHPNIVTVLSATWTDDGRPAIVMELYDQGTYEDRARRSGGRLDHLEVLETGVLLSAALQTAHDVGLVHRDIKPQNVFRSSYGAPALGDFGISVFAQEQAASVAFSPHYAPPEVLDGVTSDPRSDVYSLGVALYRLLAGRRPFESGNGLSLSNVEVYRRVLEEPPPPIGHGCPSTVERAVASALAKDPRDRPPSAAALGAALRAAQREIGADETAAPVLDVLHDAPFGQLGRAAPDEDTSSTRARRIPVTARPVETEPEREARSTARRALVGVAGVAVLGLLAGAALTAGAGADDAPSTQPTVVGPTTDDRLFELVAPPQDVVVDERDGVVRITFDGGDAQRWLVVHVADGGETYPTSEEVIEIDLSDDATPCFEVVAVGANGRESEPSPTRCA